MASGDVVQQIKDRLNIIDIVTPYTELHRAGRHFKGRCPFHSEKSPSFHVSPERGTYHCFGCGVGGDIFSFVQAIDGVEFKDALKTLAQKANVELVPENPQKRTERDELYAILEAATVYFAGQLETNSEARAYLERRGVKAETIAKWRIGYASGPPQAGWRDLRKHLSAAGYTDAQMLRAGLIKQAETGKEPFDVFRDRVMFPLRDQSGRVVAFSGRILHPHETAPKYVNSPETELYHKSELLYGYDFSKQGIRHLNFWLIVEGQFDVVMSHQAGYGSTVAVSGTALTLHHVQLLERLCRNVVLALDADKAGIAAMRRSAEIMLGRGIDVKVAKLEPGADPADMVLGDVGAFKKAIGSSVHVIEFLLEWLRTTVTDDRAYKLKVHDEVLPFVKLIPNRIDQEHFEGIIASALGTTKDAIHFEVQRLLQQPAPITAQVPSVEKNAQAPVIKSAHERQSIADAVTYLLAAERVLLVGSTKIRDTLMHDIEDFAAVRASIPDAAIDAACFEIERLYEKWTPRSLVEDLVYRLSRVRAQYLKDRLTELRAESENAGSPEETLQKTLLIQKKLQIPPYPPDFIPLGVVAPKH